jgi:Na+/melibiose symporter-like transporter
MFWAVTALYFGWSLISIPFAAWVAELSQDYHERSRLTGARTWGAIVGALLAILAPLVLNVLGTHGVSGAGPTAPGSLQPMLAVLAWLTVALLVLSMPLLLKWVPQTSSQTVTPLPWREALHLVVGNKPFRHLLFSNMSAAIGWNFINVLFLFFVTRCLGASDLQWPLIVLAYMVGQLFGTPLIVL